MASFFVNRVNFTPSCGSVRAWLHTEARAGETYAVADPDAAPPLPYERATSLPGISRWVLGVHTQDFCRRGPRWVITFDDSEPEFDRA